MEKPLEPPPPLYNQFRPQDSFIARVTDTRSLVEDDPYSNCGNGSDRLLKMLELADRYSRIILQLFRILVRNVLVRVAND